MKDLFKKVVLWLLKVMAKKRLKKYDGKIVAVTGSVGKTSTKEAIYAVLNSRFRVKKSKKGMNSDFGLLLTILDIDSGFSSVRKWSWFLMKAFWHSFFKDHSEIMLLELGVDAPGDMDFLTKLVKPDIAVITNIYPAHMAEGQFKDLESIFMEKRKLVDTIKDGGTAVLNIDNSYLERLAKELGKKRAVTYARNVGADFQAKDVKVTTEGMSFILHYDDVRYEVKASVLGEYQAYVLMPAIICGTLFKMSVEDAIVALDRYSLPPGRMNIVPAVNEATILDSSYNSSPEALKEALKVLKEVGGEKRKVAVIGNMNELGDATQSLHELIGEIVPKYADVLLTVGKNAKFVAEKAMEKGMEKKNIHTFDNVTAAADYFKEKIKKDDVILVKGSQNKVRLERFVKALMQNPDDAKKLLVRQEKVWEAKL